MELCTAVLPEIELSRPPACASVKEGLQHAWEALLAMVLVVTETVPPLLKTPPPKEAVLPAMVELKKLALPPLAL